MSRMRTRVLRGALPIVFLLSTFSFSQNATRIESDTTAQGISLHAFVEHIETPLNRTVEMTVRLEWAGDLQRYNILSLDNPILQNFDIQGSGSANTVSSNGGVDTATRKYTFTLKPQSIGMGYIEPMIVKYTDIKADADYILTTNRIPVKVTSPLAEGMMLAWLIPIIIILVVGVITLIVVRYVLAKKAARKKNAQEMEVSDVLIEEKYIAELKSVVDLNDPTMDGVKVLSQMTRLVRRYLHEKFSAPGFEATTGELYQFLYEKKFKDSFVNEMKDLLSMADIVKFSGKSVSRAEVEKSYAVIEGAVHKGQQNELLQDAQPSVEDIDS
jgi:hypothetical protein